MHRLVASFALVALAACSSTTSKAPAGASDDLSEDEKGEGTPTNMTSTMAKTGTVALTLTATAAAVDDVVSFGLPFPQGVLTNDKNVSVLDKAGQPVDISTGTLAKWPADGSIRSVLVTFKATLAKGKKESWKVEYGATPKGGDAGALAANPDGPVTATLTAQHYAASRVGGITAAANPDFPDYDANIDASDAELNLAEYAVNCDSNALHRTYYDGIHARYQRFLRSADPKHLRTAHGEAVWYRANEMKYVANQKMAITKCQDAYTPTWTPDAALDWGTLRMMLSQGNLEDYLLTGDPASKKAVLALGEAYLENLPALSDPARPILEITERNLAWPLMGLASYYALDQRAAVKDAMIGLVDRAIAWQARGTSGALEHDVNRPDPDECDDGPKGASPFMTSLVVDGMMDYWLLTGDAAKLSPFVTKLAGWYEKKAITSDGSAFRYLWNCKNNAYDDDEHTTPELNLLIAHVFGAAFVMTQDAKWITFGDKVATTGIANMYVGMPKQWNQATRSFNRYLGYRAMR